MKTRLKLTRYNDGQQYASWFAMRQWEHEIREREYRLQWLVRFGSFPYAPKKLARVLP
jgi:hypothetical protein